MSSTNLTTLVAEIRAAGAHEATRDLKDFTSAARNADSATEKLSGSAGGSLPPSMEKLRVSANGAIAPMQMLGGALALVGSLVILKGISSLASHLYDLGKAALTTADTFESMKIRLTNLRGSAADAERDFAWIQQFAIDTPATLQEVTNAFTQMLAYGLDPVGGNMEKLTDTGFALKKSMAGVEQITSAVGTAWAKQSLQGREMLRLTQAGVPAWELLEQATGKNIPTLKKLMEQGKLGRDVIQALIDAMGERYLGAAVQQMDTLGGKASNLEDVWSILLATIGGRASEDAKRALDTLIESVERFIESGKAEDIGDALAKAIRAVGEAAEWSTDHLDDFIEGYKSLKKTFAGNENAGWLDQFKVGIPGMMSEGATAAFWSGGQSPSSIVDDMMKSMNGWRKSVKDAEEAVKAHNKELGKFTDTLAKDAQEAIDELTAGLKEHGKTYKDLDAYKKKAEEEELKRLDLLFQAEMKAWDDQQTQRFKDGLKEVNTLLQDTIDHLDLVEIPVGPGSKWHKSLLDIQSAFHDLLSKGFTGEMENFADVWDSVWKDLAKAMIDHLGSAFDSWLKGDESKGIAPEAGGIGGLFDRFGKQIKEHKTRIHHRRCRHGLLR